jgi:2-polyprenyl-3-methyl-5-hydroxy-6-metoxy-1,4-benzoquinol methylase/asparagine synthetase B (glutamine-hydrolysing)
MNLFAAVIPRASWMLDEIKARLEQTSALTIPYIDRDYESVVWDNGRVLVCSYSIHAAETPIGQYVASDEQRLLTFNGVPVTSRLGDTDLAWPQELLRMCGEGKSFLEDMGGYYCLLLVEGSSVFAFNCLSGVEPLYWSCNGDCTVVGNRASLVSCLANRRNVLKPRTEAMISMCTAGWPVTDASPVEGVDLLPAGNSFSCQAGKVEIATYKPYEFNEREPSDDSELAARCESILSDFKDGLCLYGGFADRLKVNLTGGKDSRLIAALCKACGIEFSCTTSGGAADREVLVASEVARILGASHTFTEGRVIEEVPKIDIFERLDGHLRQSEGCLNVFNPSFPIRLQPSILVTGHAGECYRGGYARGPAREPVIDQASAMKFIDNLALHNAHLVLKDDAIDRQRKVDRWIFEQFLASGFPSSNTHDYMYTRYRERRGQGGARQAAAYGAFSFSPFLDDRALSKCWTFPLAFRKNEWLLYHLLKGLDPELAYLRFSDSRWKFEEAGPLPGESMDDWHKRAPIPPTPSRVAAHSWRLGYDGFMRPVIRDYLLSNRNSPVFDIVDAIKIEAVLRREGPTPHDVMASVFGVLTAAYFLNGDWLPTQGKSYPQNVSATACESASEETHNDASATDDRVVELENKLIETRNEIRYRLGEALVNCFHEPKSVSSLPKKLTSLLAEGLAKVKAKRGASASPERVEAKTTRPVSTMTDGPSRTVDCAGDPGMPVTDGTRANSRVNQSIDLERWLAESIEDLFGRGGRPAIDKSLLREFGDRLETKRIKGIDHWTYLRESRSGLPGAELLDFGCGRGRARRRVERLGFSWRGLDIADSSESKQRESDVDVTLYDGYEIPLEASSVDVVLSIQSLEHVADISKTVSELSRVLKPGGKLVGSTSHLEPYHSMSTMNYTPLGFKNLLEERGMNLERIHPGIDGLSLLLRKLVMALGGKHEKESLSGWFHDRSPLNAFLLDLAEREKLSAREINCLRLQFCGTFRFAAVKR